MTIQAVSGEEENGQTATQAGRKEALVNLVGPGLGSSSPACGPTPAFARELTAWTEATSPASS